MQALNPSDRGCHSARRHFTLDLAPADQIGILELGFLIIGRKQTQKGICFS